MKSVIRTVLVGGLAMVALSLAATGVAAAATTPEFKPVPTKHKFKGTSGAWEGRSGGKTYTCPKGTVTGELIGGQKLGNTVITFTGCTSDGSGGDECPLETRGAKSGEIISKALAGELGTAATKEAPSGVGLLLKPEGTREWWTMAENHCSGIAAVWDGDLVAEVAVIGKKQTTNKLISTPEFFKIKLDSGISEDAELETLGLEAEWKNTLELTFEEPVEVT